MLLGFWEVRWLGLVLGLRVRVMRLGFPNGRKSAVRVREGMYGVR